MIVVVKCSNLLVFQSLSARDVNLPKAIENIIKCANPSCISNSNEPVKTKFYVESEEPLLLKFHCCSYILEKKDVL